MKSRSLPELLERFPDARYESKWKLLTWHPRGVFDDKLADEIVGVVESEETFEDAPFHRYTDFSGLTKIRLQIGHVFQIAEHRREVMEPVKSAFYAESVVGFGIAHMYEALMQGGLIQVRAFRDRSSAADWLGVPLEVLQPTW